MVIALVVVLSGCSGQLPRADIPNAQPGETTAVVVDIDGTLTPRVWSIYTARPDAAEALNILADKGYRIVYLSARVRSLSAGIPGWLQKNGFPDGGVHAAQTGEDREQPAVFKSGVLNEFIDRGWTIEYAYGDSTTDFEAYATVGIPKARVFALRRAGAESCQQGAWSACLAGWAEHLEYLRQSVPPAMVK